VIKSTVVGIGLPDDKSRDTNGPVLGQDREKKRQAKKKKGVTLPRKLFDVCRTGGGRDRVKEIVLTQERKTRERARQRLDAGGEEYWCRGPFFRI